MAMAAPVSYFPNKRETVKSLCSQPNSIDDLPDDLLLEILHRLPYKISRQCLSVCKRWLSLLSDHYFLQRFISLQRHSRIEQPVTFMYRLFSDCKNDPDKPVYTRNFFTSKHSVFKSPGFSLSFLPTSKENIYIFSSSRDLLLCCDIVYHSRTYYICNPLTEQWVVLPAPFHEYESIGFFCYPFYEEDEKERHGISINHQYKYLVWRSCSYGEYSSPVKMEIFSSETRAWKTLFVSAPQNFLFPDWWICEVIPCNGVLWHNYETFLIGYNLFHKNDSDDQQRWYDINMPIDLYTCIESHIGECQERLRICQIFTLRDKYKYKNDIGMRDLEPFLRVWELEDYIVGNWSLVHNVYLKDTTEAKFYHHSTLDSFYISRIYFHPNDGDIMLIKSDEDILEFNARERVLISHSKNCPTDLKEMKGLLKPFPLTLPWYPTPVPFLQQNVNTL